MVRLHFSRALPPVTFFCFAFWALKGLCTKATKGQRASCRAARSGGTSHLGFRKWGLPKASITGKGVL